MLPLPLYINDYRGRSLTLAVGETHTCASISTSAILRFVLGDAIVHPKFETVCAVCILYDLIIIMFLERIFFR
jgi:hypothetical protein